MKNPEVGVQSEDRHPDSAQSNPAEEVIREPLHKGSSEKPPTHARKSPFRLIISAFLFLVILVIASAYFFRMASPYRGTDDVYVHGNQIPLTPRVIGTVVAINADTPDLVREGQPLVILDNSDAKVALQQAEATLGETMRKVCQFYVDVDRIKASIEATKIEITRTESDYRRRTAVHEGSVAVEEITHARAAADAARVALEVADQRLAAAKALVADTDLQNHPTVLDTAAKVLEAHLALQRTVINAPQTGYVARRNVQIGERVMPGTPLLTIIPLDQIWVDANFKEEQLRDVRIGQPVKLFADFYGDSVEFRGRVAGLDPGTGAAFALLPPQEASGNWIKIVQRVPVRILIDEKQLQKFPLRLGLSMRAVVDTTDRSGPVLAEVPPEKPVYATTIYADEWVRAAKLVERLVKTNAHALSNPGRQSSGREVQENDEKDDP